MPAYRPMGGREYLWDQKPNWEYIRGLEELEKAKEELIKTLIRDLTLMGFPLCHDGEKWKVGKTSASDWNISPHSLKGVVEELAFAIFFELNPKAVLPNPRFCRSYEAIGLPSSFEEAGWEDRVNMLFQWLKSSCTL